MPFMDVQLCTCMFFIVTCFEFGFLRFLLILVFADGAVFALVLRSTTLDSLVQVCVGVALRFLVRLGLCVGFRLLTKACNQNDASDKCSHKDAMWHKDAAWHTGATQQNVTQRQSQWQKVIQWQQVAQKRDKTLHNTTEHHKDMRTSNCYIRAPRTTQSGSTIIT